MNTIQQQDQALSARELEVLALLARGHKNSQIAITLSIKERTVRFHVENFLDKLNVENRAQAAYYAFSKGWITN